MVKLLWPGRTPKNPFSRVQFPFPRLGRRYEKAEMELWPRERKGRKDTKVKTER